MAINLYPQTTKRQKVALSSAIYALAVLLILMSGGLGVWGLIFLVTVSYGAVVYSLDFDLKYEEWLIYPLYPVLVTISLYTWANQYLYSEPVWLVAGSALIGLGMYGVILALNILNLSTVRVLPLARSAKSVMSMVGIVLSFSLYQLIVASQPSMINWVLAIGGATFLLAWPLVWTTITGKKKFLRSVGWTALAALIQMQLAIFVGWWPVSFMTSLFLAMGVFLVMGVIHFQEQKQISAAEKRQYLILAISVLVAFFITAQW